MKKTVVVCDRCGKEMPLGDEPMLPRGWSIVGESMFEVCDYCSRSFSTLLSNWMKAGKPNLDEGGET